MPGDRDEILLGIERQLILGIERRIDGEGAGLADQQRVTVGRRLGDGLGADDMRGAALVFDNDRLAPGFTQLVAERAADHVSDAARRRGDDQRDRTIRIGRRLRHGRAGNASQQDQRAAPFLHGLTVTA